MAPAGGSQPALGDLSGGIARLWKLRGVGLDVSLQTGQENVLCRGSCGPAGGDISLGMASRRDEMEIFGPVWFQIIFMILCCCFGEARDSAWCVSSVSTKCDLDPLIARGSIESHVSPAEWNRFAGYMKSSLLAAAWFNSLLDKVEH